MKGNQRKMNIIDIYNKYHLPENLHRTIKKNMKYSF